MASFPFISTLTASVILGVAVFAPSAAGAINELTSVSDRKTVNAKSLAEFSLQCRQGFALVSHVVTPARPESMVLLGQQGLLANGTAPLIDGIYAEATGVKVTAYNNFDASQVLDIQVLCAKFAAENSGALVAGVINVTAKQRRRVAANCPQGYYATGGGYHATTVAARGQYPHWQVGPALSERADGPQAEAADAWAADADNPGTTDQPFRTYAYCRKVPSTSLQINVASFLLEPGERRFLGITFENFLFAISGGMSGNAEGLELGGAVWRPAKPPFAQTGFNFTTPYYEFAPGGGGLLGIFGRDLRPSLLAKQGLVVKLGTIATPTQESARPVNIVPAIEYYNLARDHYFVTSIPQEIADLDNGVHPGWQRTGQRFNVYAAGSGGPLGRLPVCRYYGLPSAGLDSHFYTASVLECLDVGAKFAGAWQIESGEVFQIHFPNIDTGACPAGTIAIMRTWNKRADSNHRYVITIALRDQMLQQGHVSEGYGPNGVAFCAPA